MAVVIDEDLSGSGGFIFVKNRGTQVCTHNGLRVFVCRTIGGLQQCLCRLTSFLVVSVSGVKILGRLFGVVPDNGGSTVVSLLKALSGD